MTRCRYTDFPELVVVLDENNSKVRVQKKDGSAVWIRKFFLLKEMPGESSTEEAGLHEALDVFKSIVAKLPGNLSEKEQRSVAKAISSIENVIKDMVDTH